MNPSHPLAIPAALLILLQPAAAELTTQSKAPFIGFHAGFQNKKVHITLSNKAMLAIRPFGIKGEPIIDKAGIRVELGIEEVPANGNPIWHNLDASSLTSKQPGSDDFQKAEITGKAIGGASFAATIENQRGTITIQGKVTDPGPLTKHPLRLCIRMVFPDPYPFNKAESEKAKDEFKEKLEDDRLQLRWSDGSRKKFDFAESVDAKSKEVNGPGITDAEVEVSSYNRNKVRISAGSQALLSLRNAAPAPLREGFEFRWFVPDPSKDPKNQARLTIEVK